LIFKDGADFVKIDETSNGSSIGSIDWKEDVILCDNSDLGV
jgi:hypothetical protein